MNERLARCARKAGHASIALLALLSGGLLLLLPADHIRQQELAAGLRHPAPPILSRADALSQQLALFTLGGLRSLAAEILSIDATRAWMNQDWPLAEKRWNEMITLCPNRPNYYIRASYDMAKNAVAFVRSDQRLTMQERAILARHYIRSGEEFLLKGIARNPEQPLLYLELGSRYEDVLNAPQFLKAAAAYRQAVERGASPMYLRWEFYNLCRVRGKEQEAWQLGKELMKEQRHHSPSLCCLMFVLQNKLRIPEAERYSIAQLFGSREAAIRQLTLFSNNTMRFPIDGVREYLRQQDSHSSARG